VSKAIKRLLNLVIKTLLLTLKSAGSRKRYIRMWGWYWEISGDNMGAANVDGLARKEIKW